MVSTTDRERGDAKKEEPRQRMGEDVEGLVSDDEIDTMGGECSGELRRLEKELAEAHDKVCSLVCACAPFQRKCTVSSVML